MIKIDWVKIPAGDFTPALSPKQIDIVRARAYSEVDFSKWSDEEKRILQQYLDVVGPYWQENVVDSIHAKWPFPTSRTPPEIVNLLRKYNELHNLLDIERYLTEMDTYTRLGKQDDWSLAQYARTGLDMKTFYMARFPMTETECQPFFDKYPLDEEDEREIRRYGQNRPIAIDYRPAKRFCEWVGGRLPTAAEWEYAARGPESFFYPWGNEWDPLRGNLYGDNRAAPVRPDHLKDNNHFLTPVDGYPAGVSPFGIWDMLGNLAEWITSARHRGRSLRERRSPAWFYYMPVFNNSGDPFPGYIGFRPVKDTWDPQLWSGHDLTEG